MTTQPGVRLPSDALERALRRFRERTDSRVVVLTGAGISAESGIPTFRGPEGYWQPGNPHVPHAHRYAPEELATWTMFSRAPEVVWPWYLFRRATCLAAEPNAAHHALAALERRLGGRLMLLTQNVDGLHPRAGSTRLYEIHGNLHQMRCLGHEPHRACAALTPVPSTLDAWPRERPWDDAARAALVCGRCGAPARPHVLWFDECYDEAHFRWDSSHRVVTEADLLVVVGTAGATNLPSRMGQLALSRGIPIVDVNPGANPFAELTRRSGGAALALTAVEALPPLVDALIR